MRCLALAASALLFAAVASAQADTVPLPHDLIAPQQHVDEAPPPPGDEVITFAQEMPQYAEGELYPTAALARLLVYPPEAKEAGIMGKVFLEYVVERDGSITNIRVVRGVHPLLDKAAVDGVKRLKPYLTPGKIDGKPVRLRVTLPVPFKP